MAFNILLYIIINECLLSIFNSLILLYFFSWSLWCNKFDKNKILKISKFLAQTNVISIKKKLKFLNPSSFFGKQPYDYDFRLIFSNILCNIFFTPVVINAMVQRDMTRYEAHAVIFQQCTHSSLSLKLKAFHCTVVQFYTS